MAAWMGFSKVSIVIANGTSGGKSTYIAEWLDAEAATGTSSKYAEYRLTVSPASF